MSLNGMSATAGTVGLLVLLAGCDGASSASPPPAPTTTTQPARSSAAEGIRIDLPVTRTVSVSDAVAATFAAPPTTVKLTASPGHYLTPREVGETGDLVAVESAKEPLDDSNRRIVRPSRVGLVRDGTFSDSATSASQTRGVLRGRMRQITEATQTGPHLIWVETPSAELDFAEWSLRTTTVGPGRQVVRELAHSPELKGESRLVDVVGGTDPVVIDDWVYWATAVPTVTSPRPDHQADWEFDVQRTKLSVPSKVETVVRNAVMPTGLDHALVYATFDPATPNTYEIHRRDVGPGQADRILVRGYRSGTSWITNLAARGRLVVWTAQSPGLAEEGWVPGETTPGQVFVLDTASGKVTRIVTEDAVGSNGSIAFTRRGIAWGNGSGNGDPTEYVLDLADLSLVELGQQQGASEVMASPGNDVVLWSSNPDEASATVVWHRATLAGPTGP